MEETSGVDARVVGPLHGLLAENLERIDEAGLPAHLESSNPANLDRYEPVGFEKCGEFTLPDGGPTVTTMWRERR